ncbi:hypothetical protein AAVH_42196, partial [Aphelenchoides avenae]
MTSSVTSSDSYEAVPSVQEVAELRADLAEKAAEVAKLQKQVRALQESDAKNGQHLETLMQ